MPPVNKPFGERIADAMIEDGLLTQAQVDELLVKQKKEGKRFLNLIIDEKLVTDQDMVVCMGRVLNTPPVNLARVGVDKDLADLVPKEMATNHKVVPVARLGNKLYLAMADPLNVLAKDDVKRVTKLDVAPMIAPERAIMEKIAAIEAGKGVTLSEIVSQTTEAAEAEVAADAENLEVTKEATEELSLDQMEAGSGEAPVIKLANIILVQAIKDRCSDIHIEPFEKFVKLRYRLDGALMEQPPIPKSMQVPLTSRIKIMANLDIAERRLPQDGRMRVKVGGRDIDMRVSFLPVVHGEKCVMRVLDKSNLSASMDKLGMDPDSYRRLKAAVDAPHGLILVTGPTGSGKTTTLYSCLNELNNPDYNIVTVEDPVEFQIPGINQVPVKKEIGLTFAAALRSILRQDPDIVMIGEIRDEETAEIAVEAALTGHQVLSTMHCNDAPGAIARLDDMGIAPFLISSAVILSCAQRLMRRICNGCKEEVTYPAKMYEDLNLDPNFFEGGKLHRGRGCDRCKNTGYQGRVAIIEIMTITDEIRKMIIKRASAMEIGKVAIEQGMKTLRMVALDKVKQGLSTLEQTLVVTPSH